MIAFAKSDGVRKYFVALILIWLVYVILTLLAPAAESSARYGLSLFQTNLLRVTILVPYLLIWFAGLFAVLRFWTYSKSISGSEESLGFRKITFGLMALLAVVVVPPFINIIAAYNPSVFTIQKVTTILRNYATAGLYLISFYYLWEASNTLGEAFGYKTKLDKRANLIAIIIIVTLGTFYVWSVFQNHYRSVSSDSLVKPTYYLSDGWILLTIVIPYVLIWTLGCLTLSNLYSLYKTVPGIIYKKMFASVNRGLFLTVALVIGLQFLSQTTYFLNHASLSIILIIIYILLLLIAVGYLFLAQGAKSLSTIEEA